MHIPALRERDGDAILLAKYFLQRFAADLNKSFRGFYKEAIAAISTYGWPGNVRELENRLKRAIVLADGKFIGVNDLDIDMKLATTRIQTLREVRDAAEREAIGRALRMSRKNLTAAAKALGVSRPTLYDLMKTHNLTAAG